MIRPCSLLAAASAALVLAGLGAPSVRAQSGGAQSGGAQPEGDRRIDRLEKQVRELRSIIFQGRDTGQPVEVKPAGPDPDVTALEQKLQSQADAIRQMTGQIEVLQHDADEARQAAAGVREQNGQLGGQLKDLGDRVVKLEQASQPAPPASTPPPGTGPGQGTLNAQAAAGPAAPPPPPPTAAQSYKHARALFTAGDYARAGDAFQAFISQYGDSPEVPAAYYWLGQSDSQRQDYTDAVAAYANALKGWPKASWAGDATVSLGRALAETNQAGQACAALAEFDRRYRAGAAGTVKTHAADVRTRAHCGQ